MSSLWLNLRFGAWHLQFERRGLRSWLPRLSFNNYHQGKPLWNVQLYELRRPWA
jgi:hypothetical protein